MNKKNFQFYSEYYDLFYKDKDYVKEVFFIIKLLKKNKVKTGNILEFGSGTGKHGVLFAKNAFNVTGIESSKEMVLRSKKEKNFTVHYGDIKTTNLGKKFDVILSLFHVLSYQVSNKNINLVFSNAARHLRSGGLFFFDIWYSPAVVSQTAVVRVKKVVNENFQLIRIAEPFDYPNENKILVKYTFYLHSYKNNSSKIFTEDHYMRHFSTPEINFLADLHGFKILSSSEFPSNSVPSEKTWSIGFLLMKL